jgi:hypothetical protein
VLRVHYSAKTAGDVTHDAYVLKLETKGGILQGVAISESSTEAGYKQETGSWENAWQSEFEIHHDSHGPNHGWSFSDSYDDNWQIADASNGGPRGEGLSQECRLPMSVPRPLYWEVLLMLERAKRHVLSASGRLPFLACETRDGSADSSSSLG